MLYDFLPQVYRIVNPNPSLKVNPILGAYLTRGLFSSIVGRWKKKYRCKIEVVETTDFTVLQNEFYDEKGGFICVFN